MIIIIKTLNKGWYNKMDFKEWRGSEGYDAMQYRWYVTSCFSAENSNFANLAAKHAFEAGKKEGLKEAKDKLVKLITKHIMG